MIPYPQSIVLIFDLSVQDKPSSSSYYLSSSSVPRREVSATADKYLNSAAKTAKNLARLDSKSRWIE